jgi:hypothetical protein
MCTCKTLKLAYLEPLKNKKIRILRAGRRWKRLAREQIIQKARPVWKDNIDAILYTHNAALGMFTHGTLFERLTQFQNANSVDDLKGFKRRIMDYHILATSILNDERIRLRNYPYNTHNFKLRLFYFCFVNLPEEDEKVLIEFLEQKCDVFLNFSQYIHVDFDEHEVWNNLEVIKELVKAKRISLSSVKKVHGYE